MAFFLFQKNGIQICEEKTITQEEKLKKCLYGRLPCNLTITDKVDQKYKYSILRYLKNKIHQI